MSKMAIRMENLTRDFESKDGRVRALDGLTLEVPAGTVFGFLGPNGAGKTTTIRLPLGLLELSQPRRGDGRSCGAQVSRSSVRDSR
jgi:ABC-2 type transport system ATP-binding protein